MVQYREKSGHSHHTNYPETAAKAGQRANSFRSFLSCVTSNTDMPAHPLSTSDQSHSGYFVISAWISSKIFFTAIEIRFLFAQKANHQSGVFHHGQLIGQDKFASRLMPWPRSSRWPLL
jgi:hypothetical protein